jgi:elongator complex protein 1
VIESVFTITHASSAPPHDHGAVAVIDGQSIKITPFRTANVPPPMALHEFQVQSNAIDVAFNADASLIAVLHQHGISIFEWKSVSASSSPPVLTGRVTFEKIELPAIINQHISFAGKDEVVVMQRSESSSSIKRYGFNEDTGRMEELASAANPSHTASTLSYFFQDRTVHPFVQGRKGDLHSLTFGEHTLSHCNFPIYLPWVEIVSFGDDHIAFGMSSSGQLYANSRLLIKNCTSFLVTPAHLIFTTTTHLLKFVHITDVNGIASFSPSLAISSNACQTLKFRQMTQKKTNDAGVLSVALV